MENREPRRQQCRKDTDEPSDMHSITDKRLPNLATPYKDTEEPKRIILRSENWDPNDRKSRRDICEPIREQP
jgi:hypothetical protein